MAMEGSYAGTANATRPDYVTEQIGMRLAELSESLQRLENLAAHICGSSPQPAGIEGRGKLESVANGLFEEWRATLDSLVTRARVIANTLGNSTGA